MARYDWHLIREEYVEGTNDVTLESLAAKDNAPVLGTIKNRSSKEDWPALRRQYRDLVVTKSREKASTLEAEIRTRHIKLARAMQSKAERRLLELSPAELDATELRLYLKDAADIERRAAGIPDAHEHGGIQIVVSEDLAEDLKKL